MGKVYDKILEFEKKYPGGLSWRTKKHARVIEDYLDSDEEVLFAFAGQKNEKMTEIFHSFAFALTNKRILLGQKRLIWGSFLNSITPDLYNDMQIYQGLLWGKITIDTVREKIVLSNLPKSGLDAIETTVSNFMTEMKKKYNNEEDKEA